MIVDKFLADLGLISKPAGTFLCNIHLMTAPVEHYDGWQYDFYDPATKKLASFVVTDEACKQVNVAADPAVKTSEFFELDVQKVKISVERVVSDALLYVDGEAITKYIFILQVQKGRIVWNVSAITSTFNVAHMVIDAESGERVSATKESLIDLRNLRK